MTDTAIDIRIRASNETDSAFKAAQQNVQTIAKSTVADIRTMEQGFTDFERKQRVVGDGTREAAGAFGQMKGSAVALATALGVTAAAAVALLANEMKASVQEAHATEIAYARQTAILATTEARTDQLRATIRNLRDEAGKGAFSMSALEMAYAGVAFEGLNAAQRNDLLTSAMHLAALTGQDLARTTIDLDGVTSAWGDKVRNATQVADILVTTQVKTGTAVSETSQFLRENGAILGELGFDIETAAALYGHLTDRGVQGARSIVLAYAELGDKNSDLRKKVKDLGVEVTDASGRMESLPVILQRINAAGLDAEEVMGLFGNRTGATMNIIIAEGPKAEATMRDLGASAGAAAEAFTRLDNEDAQKVQRMKARWADFWTSFGAGAYDAGVAVGDLAQVLDFETIGERKREMREMSDEIVALGGVVARFSSFDDLAAQLEDLRAAQENVAVATVGITTPLERMVHLLAVETKEAIVSHAGAVGLQTRALIEQAAEWQPLQNLVAHATRTLTDHEKATRELREEYGDYASVIAHATARTDANTWTMRGADAVARQFGKSVADLTTDEQRLAAQMGRTMEAIAGQDEVTRLKNETTAEFVARIREATNGEVDLSNVVTDTTQSIRLQQDATGAWKLALEGASSAVAAGSAGLASYQQAIDGTWVRMSGLTEEMQRAIAASHALNEALGTHTGGHVAPPGTVVGNLSGPNSGMQIYQDGASGRFYLFDARDGRVMGGDQSAADSWWQANNEGRPLAEGGVTTGPTRRLIGDNPSGRELVLPLERAHEMGFGGGGGLVVHGDLNITVKDGRDLERTLRRYGLHRRGT